MYPFDMSDIPGKLHGRKTPPGTEAKILRKMPLIFVVATLCPTVLSLFVRWFPQGDSVAATAKHILTVDIFVIASIATIWTALLTVTIGCVLVHIMKGPGYVADAYPLDSRDTPARGDPAD